MISFSLADILIIISFFIVLIVIGLIPKKESDTESYLLSNRSVGLFLFIMTNVSTWYGGILGVGEFTYRYGVVSWVTQGLPYYFFAFLFALFFASKVRNANLYTIPEKLENVYGKKVGIVSSIIVFILVSPAPYLLMVGNLFSLIFGINLIYGLLIGLVLSSIYLFKSGYRSDLYTDVFQFFVMFIGFGIALFFTKENYGGIEFLKNHLPSSHLSFNGNVSITYLIVWFLIALWTFADPGFHQRCYAAKNGSVAKWGIIISIFLWAIFDFLTTTTGLYSRALIPNLSNPVLSFPMFAEKSLSSGIKGLFIAALFATIFSTLNSFLFLSATTIGKDFLSKINLNKNKSTTFYTRVGLIVSSLFSIMLAYYVQSVIELWYLIGSIFVPGIIFLIISAYYPKLKVKKEFALIEILAAVLSAGLWALIRNIYNVGNLSEIEPMLIGIFVAAVIHSIGREKKLSV
jgi:SSS family solute:Na+ symporter